jgi:hypothetical protein
VTTTLWNPAPTPLSPVVNRLAVMNVRHPMEGLVPGLTVADPEGWTPASALITGDRFDDMIETAQRRWQAPAHVAGALAWKAYAYWVALPAVLGYATARRVPLLNPETVLLRYSDHRPFLCVALHEPVLAVLPDDPIAASDDPGVRVVPDDAALLAALRSSLVERHFHPLVERLHRQLHLGRRTLWGSLASGVSHGLNRAGGYPRDWSTIEVANKLLAALDVADLVALTEQPGGELAIQRNTCCLAFALAEPKICSGCVIRTA